ncbi:hypothetical protein GW940_01130 [Candidatus Microgenomates bacterium]|nr:hypothetical protein [Candidatus Microgenomates bacterium]
MMRKNNITNPYLPWEVDLKNFPIGGKFMDKAEFLIRYAILAPNSHNTQPWRFEITKESIQLLPDLERSLYYSDRENRELYISLGCALGNLLVAADYFGFHVRIEYLPESRLNGVAVELFLTKRTTKSLYSDMFSVITKRSTDRGVYEDKQLNVQTIDKLRSRFKDSGVSLGIVTSKRDIEKAADLVYKAIMFAFRDTIFKEELSTWVRPNNTKKFDGMPLSGFGVPGIISLFAPYLIKLTNPSIQANMERRMVLNSTGLLVISSAMDDKVGWLKTGKLYSFLTLAFLIEGIGTAPFSGMIEYKKVRTKLMKMLGIEMSPTFFARMGYSNNSPHHSPRRDVAQLLSKM